MPQQQLRMLLMSTTCANTIADDIGVREQHFACDVVLPFTLSLHLHLSLGHLSPDHSLPLRHSRVLL